MRLRGSPGNWKLAAIDHYAGRNRPLAWIDDAHDEHCAAWAAAHPAPTLLIGTDPATGLTEGHVIELLQWARLLTPRIALCLRPPST